MTATAVPASGRTAAEPDGLVGWLLTRDHKRIGIMILAAGFLMFLFDGVLGLTMRAQLAQPNGHILSAQQYIQFFTMHGTGMIAVSRPVLRSVLGLYLVPLTGGRDGDRRAPASRCSASGFTSPARSLIMWAWLTRRRQRRRVGV